jgi:hypothetical protein
VTWCYNDDYCGWAPLPPGVFYSDTVGLVYNGAAAGVADDFGLGADSFVFVSLNYFGDPHPFQHRLNRDQARRVYGQTPILNQFERRGQGYVNRGIDPASITRVTHTAIQPVTVPAAGRLNGRLTPGGPAARAGAAVNPGRPQVPGGPNATLPRTSPAVANSPQTVTVTGNRYNENVPGPGTGRNQAPLNNGHAPERASAPAPAQNQWNAPAATPRLTPPVTVNRPSYPEPRPEARPEAQRPEPLRPAVPMPENRPVEPANPVARMERVTPPPAPAAAQPPAQSQTQNQTQNAAQPPAAKSGKNGN